MRTILLAFLPFLSLAQATLLPSGPASVQRGASFTVNIVASGGTVSGPVGVQWTLTLPTGWVATTPTTALPNKSIPCATGNLKCIVYGPTVTAVIPNGNVASLVITVPPNATLGAVSISTSATFGVTNLGAAIPTTGGSISINVVPDARDLNGDGVVDQTDVIAAVNQIFGTCTTADIAPPVGCDVIDLMIITLKAQALIP